VSHNGFWPVASRKKRKRKKYNQKDYDKILEEKH
jgi:hypothetical protein